MADTHVVSIGLVKVNAVGNVTEGGGSDIDINTALVHDTEHRILPNSGVPNSTGYPTMAQYLRLEASINYLPCHIDQYIIVTALSDISKIDSLATEGLLGTYNSLAYRVHEIEKHFHNKERWFGIAAPQTVTNWATGAPNLTAFQAISGNGTWGADANDEAQVLGSADTPCMGMANVKYDLHRILVSAMSSATSYALRVIWGTGTMAAAIIARDYSETYVIKPIATGQAQGSPIPILMPRQDVGTQVWVQCANGTDNATIDFFVGLHEYEG